MAAHLMICTRCGSQAYPKKHTPGSFGVELLLFLFFIIPGIIYGVWRLSGRKLVCPACGSDAIVPTETPAGRALAQQFLGETTCSKCGSRSKEKFCPNCGEELAVASGR
jgi:predicted RNA-binding Zn-ribbon protein involved in translation (DUF1610 family)